ncbi:MAG: MBOAT family protein [Clostridiales bacterium]|nr:MBOAT family protein [Clostridiales bacterium]
MPAVLLGYRFLPDRAKRPFLLAASLVFYGWGAPVWLILLLYVMALDYAGALLVTRIQRGRRLLFAALIVLNLVPLIYFKYAGFLRDTLETLTGIRIRMDSPLLPAGISFFTFQGISYLADVFRGKAKVQRNFVLFGTYLSMFPQLVAGPIVRYTDLEAQLEKPAEVSTEDMRAGLERFAVGLGKKVLLADAMGRFWAKISADLPGAGALGAWMGLAAFSFQIFFDFSGYSDMALGLGKAMGFTFPENFDRPYRARSLTEFWRRWHMSLTTWFREYVYIPLGGNRKGEWRRNLNILIVWALTGLWHGAGWNFVLWGVWFGVLLIIEKKWVIGRKGTERLPGWLRQALTYLPVLIGWGMFTGKWQVFPAMAGTYGWSTPAAVLECLSFLPMFLVCAGISFLPKPKVECRRWAAPVLMVLCLAALAAQGYAPFVYFQF